MTPETPLLVVGLGNPGSRYRDTRHNVGFRVVEALARRRGWAFVAGAGPWREAGGPGGGGLVLLAPLTFMNLSGEAVVAWAARHGVAVGGPDRAALPGPVELPGPADLPDETDPTAGAPVRWRPLVICDDLALPLGAVRLRARGSSGGQKGLESIIASLGHDDFPRLRLGIAPAGDPVPPAQWADFVLTPFDPDDEPVVAEMTDWAADAVECCLERDFEVAVSRFNRRSAPLDGPGRPSP